MNRYFFSRWPEMGPKSDDTCGRLDQWTTSSHSSSSFATQLPLSPTTFFDLHRWGLLLVPSNRFLVCHFIPHWALGEETTILVLVPSSLFKRVFGRYWFGVWRVWLLVPFIFSSSWLEPHSSDATIQFFIDFCIIFLHLLFVCDLVIFGEFHQGFGVNAVHHRVEFIQNCQGLLR